MDYYKPVYSEPSVLAKVERLMVEIYNKSQCDAGLPQYQVKVRDQSRSTCEIDADEELRKLRSRQYERNSLMEMVRAEKECYRTATKELQVSNVFLKSELSRIGKSFQEVLDKWEEESRLIDRLRLQNEALEKQNSCLQNDLSEAVTKIDRSEHLLADLKQDLKTKNNKKSELEEKKLQEPPSWPPTTTTAEKPETFARTWRRIFSKFLIYGSVLTLTLRGVIHVAQGGPHFDCDYVVEPLGEI